MLEFDRAGLSELDVIQKNVTGLNKRTVYCHFQKLKQTGTSLRKSGRGRRYKLTNMHKEMIFEIIKSYHFLTVKEIADRASSNLTEVDRISPTTVWRFITGSNMETGLQLGSLLLHIGSQMMDLTWSNKDQSYKAVSIFETVI